MMYPFAISFDGRENPREAVAHVLRQTSVGRDLFAIGWNAAMQFQKSAAFSQSRALPMPVNVIFRAPATIVFWDDGDKTVVKCQPGDTYCAEDWPVYGYAQEVYGQRQYFQPSNRQVAGACSVRQYSRSPGGCRVIYDERYPAAHTMRNASCSGYSHCGGI